MSGVLIGFAIIGVVIALGYGLGRTQFLGPHAQFVMSRLVFFITTPALLFHTIATADISVLFSKMLIASLLAALVVTVGTGLVFRFVLGRSVPRATVAALSAGYVNANNIGLPVAVYVLGSATYVVPIILLQLIVLAPISLTILDITTSSGGSLGRRILGPVSNPLIIASLLGLLISAFHITVPTPVMEPFTLVGSAAVPIVLMSFGMSLHGSAPLRDPEIRTDVVVATGIKLLAMPAIAFLLGAFVFRVSAEHLFVLTVLAGLPTAQNVFNYAQRYQAAVPVARDVVLLSTIGAVPVLVLVAALLHP
jgi:malonate transporter and related proteins